MDKETVTSAAEMLERDLATRDEQTVALSRALRRLDAVVERDGWDQPPQLWVVTGDGAGGKLRWHKKRVWVDGDRSPAGPAGDLAALTRTVLAARAPVIADLVGVALVSEGWAVATSIDDVGTKLQAARARTLHTEPDRYEVRTITCVDVTGLQYGHALSRDPARWGRFETVNEFGRIGPGASMLGAVPTELHRLLGALVEIGGAGDDSDGR